MVRIVVLSACALLVATQASSACNYLSDRSVVFADNTMPVCEDVLIAWVFLAWTHLTGTSLKSRLKAQQKVTGINGLFARKTRRYSLKT